MLGLVLTLISNNIWGFICIQSIRLEATDTRLDAFTTLFPLRQKKKKKLQICNFFVPNMHVGRFSICWQTAFVSNRECFVGGGSEGRPLVLCSFGSYLVLATQLFLSLHGRYEQCANIFLTCILYILIHSATTYNYCLISPVDASFLFKKWISFLNRHQFKWFIGTFDHENFSAIFSLAVVLWAKRKRTRFELLITANCE